MTTTKALSGLRPSSKRGGTPNSAAMNEYRIASAYGSNIFTGDIVINNAGNVEVPVTINAIALGVFMGCRYVQDGEQKFSRHWPASTSATDAVALVCDDPNQVYVVQADASLSVGDMYGYNFDVTLGAGSTFTGKSGFGLDAATRKATSGMLRVVGEYKTPGNDIDNAAQRAFPEVQVRIVQHVDAVVSVGVSTFTTL